MESFEEANNQEHYFSFGLNYDASQSFTPISQFSTSQNSVIQSSISSSFNSNQSILSEDDVPILHQPKKKRRGGPNPDLVWSYFYVGEHLGEGHYGAGCKHCPTTWSRGRPQQLKRHLARECQKVPQEIKEFWRNSLAEDEKTVKRKHKIENNIRLDQPNMEIISDDRQREIDRAVLKAWVCAGFPFETIDNPFVIDMFKTLNRGYNPPSRYTLSERILDEEVAKVEKSIDDELKSEMNLTLSK